jgi:hypothetical protein
MEVEEKGMEFAFTGAAAWLLPADRRLTQTCGEIASESASFATVRASWAWPA